MARIDPELRERIELGERSAAFRTLEAIARGLGLAFEEVAAPPDSRVPPLDAADAQER